MTKGQHIKGIFYHQTVKMENFRLVVRIPPPGFHLIPSSGCSKLPSKKNGKNTDLPIFLAKNGKNEKLPVFAKNSPSGLPPDSEFGWTQEEIGESIGITQKGFAKKFLEQNGKNEKLPISSKKSPSGLPANSSSDGRRKRLGSRLGLRRKGLPKNS